MREFTSQTPPMLFHIDPRDSRPIYVQIMDEIRRAIVLEALRPDDALPSVRQLATELRLNPNTVAQAYRELERDGVLYVKRGQGTFIAQTKVREKDRKSLVVEVASRALLDADRNGIGADLLIDAIRSLAGGAKASSRSGARRG